MFYKVQVLDAKGKLKKLFTSQMLSKRHWDLFPDNLNNLKQKNKFNPFKEKKLLPTGISNYRQKMN